MNHDEYVLLKAKVIRRGERENAVLTVQLEDGFGHAECVVHKDAVVPE